jgi:2-hydroxycyclohexanecarboxyl-CoA dehydrogenase
VSTSVPNQVVVVTGAASGIGAAICAEMRSRGWLVAGLDLSPAPACTWSTQVDVTDLDAVAAAVREVERELGLVTAAVSAAGYYQMQPVTQISTESWMRMLRVHLGGLVNLTRAVLPGMLAQNNGSLVAITSELAIGGGSDDVHYASAKGAIIGMVRSLAAEVASAGVRVNAVAPGPTDTPLLASDSPWRAPDYLATLPVGRLSSPQEVALCVAYLIDEGGFCVGEVLNPNAGAVI